MTHPIVEGLTESVTMAKLMRENEELRGDVTAWMSACNIAANDLLVARGQLAEEKALADGFFSEVTNMWPSSCEVMHSVTAYRKARGL